MKIPGRTFRQELTILAVLLLCCGAMLLIPEPKRPASSGAAFRGTVLSTDDSMLQKHGLLLFGSQLLEVRADSGKAKGKVFRAVNELRAQMELDKLFEPGDRVILSAGTPDPPESEVLTARDHNRSFWTYLLFGAFCVLLCVFGGWTGLKALFSFVLSCLVIWKAVIPLALRGWPASWTIFGSVCFLTAAIIYLVAGLNKKGTVAFLGGIAGVFAGLLMARIFSVLMKINGAAMPYSQTLFYSGYDFLNLQDIFTGAMILASSGAVMDLAMDIAAGVHEVHFHNPNLPRRELIASGMRMGRSVVGTMTTTLLLAYSGGYLTLLMMFCAQGTPPQEFISNPLVAAEAVKTLIGSFSLVLVAPFTAVAAGLVYPEKT